MNPFGGPPVTAREFIDAAALAEAAVYALYFPGHSQRITAANASGGPTEHGRKQTPKPIRHAIRRHVRKVCEICLPSSRINIDLMRNQLHAQLESAMRQGTSREIAQIRAALDASEDVADLVL